MREDPGLPVAEIAVCLEQGYGIRASSIEFLPVGYDYAVSVYRVKARGGQFYFLKVRSGPVNEVALRVPRALTDAGVPNILAPIPASSGLLWQALGEDTAVLYPFIDGNSAMKVGLTDAQWREFGETLRSVHLSGLEERFAGVLPRETFALPSAALVRRLVHDVPHSPSRTESVNGFIDFWAEQTPRIYQILQRAEELGHRLQTRCFEHVLCHADIHAANILAGEDGRIWLVDWDGPLIAPRERDLLFVVQGNIARRVLPREEALFFEGYGSFHPDREALIYYRYERIVEDIGMMGDFILFSPNASEEARAAELEMLMGFFAPGRDIDLAEAIP